MESSLAQTNPALFAKVQAHAESTLDCGTGSLQRSPEPSPLTEAVAAYAAATASTIHPAATATPSPSTSLAIPYSHEAMVELMVAQPTWNHKQLAKHFGKGAGWFAAVLASDSFQLEMDKRRSEIANPALTATMEERFRGLTLRALDVLQDKLDSKEVSDNIVLRAAEIGVKALGMGQVAPQVVQPAGSVESLADRLVAAFEKQRGNVRKPAAVMDAEVVVVAEAVESGETR